MHTPRTTGYTRILVCAALLPSIAACTEFATPAELSRPQILAINAEPPIVPPGQSTVLSILVADEDGPIAAPEITWTVTALNPGTLPLGTVADAGAGQALYTAPQEVAENPTFSSVQAEVQIADRELPLIAIKGIGIGTLPLQNPTLTSFTIGVEDAMTDDSIFVQRGATLEVAITTDPPADDNSAVAWYATIGTIERYQSTPAELLVQDEPGSGWLIAVARNGFGGVIWRAVPILVE